MCLENYKIIDKDGMIQALSKERIPYEPKGWQKDFRAELRCALTKLPPATENQCLVASYCGKGDNFFDLENVLFYNIGAASFSQIAAYRIFAENLSQQAVNEKDNESALPHCYTYKICDAATCKDFWKNRSLAAEWEPVPVSASFSKNKAIDYWQALRENPDKIKLHHKISGSPFGVKIKLSIPKAKSVNLTSVVKPLLDGIICAFHSADNRLQKECGSIASRLGVSEQLLLCTDYDILGACRFIYPYRGTSVKWNPQDDRCLAFEIEAEHSDDDTCRFSGEIYKLP